MVILSASWVAPMDVPIIRDGAVAIAGGRIVAVGVAKQIVKEYPAARRENLGAAILLPGLINAHTHLELSDRTQAAPTGSFADWVMSLRGGTLTPAAATHLGIDQSLKFGVTCVGDISQISRVSREVIARSPLRAVSFGEVLGLGQRRTRFEELLPDAIDRSLATSRLRIGISPHSPYTVDLEGFERCLSQAIQHHLPLATHLAEVPEEREFLANQSGPLRGMWDKLSWWESGIKTFNGSPIEMAESIGLLRNNALLAHVNDCNDDELNLLARGNASVVYCPRTHAYFGRPAHRWREMIARGINVAVGTDSCVSSPDLNLVDDLRQLRAEAPEIDAQLIWQLATTRSARALGWQDQIGSIAANKSADLIAFDVGGDDPLEELLCGKQLPKSIWIEGNRLTDRSGPASRD